MISCSEMSLASLIGRWADDKGSTYDVSPDLELDSSLTVETTRKTGEVKITKKLINLIDGVIYFGTHRNHSIPYTLDYPGINEHLPSTLAPWLRDTTPPEIYWIRLGSNQAAFTWRRMPDMPRNDRDARKSRDGPDVLDASQSNAAAAERWRARWGSAPHSSTQEPPAEGAATIRVLGEQGSEPPTEPLSQAGLLEEPPTEPPPGLWDEPPHGSLAKPPTPPAQAGAGEESNVDTAPHKAYQVNDPVMAYWYGEWLPATVYKLDGYYTHVLWDSENTQSKIRRDDVVARNDL